MCSGALPETHNWWVEWRRKMDEVCTNESPTYHSTYLFVKSAAGITIMAHIFLFMTFKVTEGLISNYPGQSNCVTSESLDYICTINFCKF
jgi:hypothetical protein